METKKKRKILRNLYILICIPMVFVLTIIILQKISNNNLTIFGIRIFKIITGSMEPVYNVGDVIISKEIKPEKIKVGDDIVFVKDEAIYNSKLVLHRVISIEQKEDGNYKIITKGVANDVQDPEINQNQIYGKIISKAYILTFVGKISKNIYLLCFIILIPLAIMIYKNRKTKKRR